MGTIEPKESRYFNESKIFFVSRCFTDTGIISGILKIVYYYAIVLGSKFPNSNFSNISTSFFLNLNLNYSPLKLFKWQK